jgi:hypothetical protein
MSATMAEPKKKPGRGKPKAADRHTEPRESFHLPQALLDALLTYVDRTRPETSKSAVIRLALEEFLASKGLYKPEDGES